MDYQYETLGPERFQQFVQALLTRSYPNLQCLPVAQPDGGRDAYSWSGEANARRLLVFQVKYVRRPQALERPHAWLTETLESELDKVEKLVPKGVEQYLLITNVPGTSHLDVGSVDLVDKMLSEKLGVQGQCWWRDDLNRRLDDAWDIKWSYPELMAGTDILRLIVEEGLTEDRSRRTSAVKAFVQDQYDHDKEVKFKQVELQNDLLELFVDVPLAVAPDRATARRGWRLANHVIARLARQPEFQAMPAEDGSEYPEFFRELPHVGATDFLLASLTQERMPFVVLEGAPGQGKSTLVQYVCQVHRMRLLEDDDALARLPAEHRNQNLRLPVKVDLRDLAAWLRGHDPFTSDDIDISEPHGHPRTLEAFLAALVRTYSGGADFSVSDLHAVAGVSSVLLVLDGLDEVADLSTRAAVVQEVQRAVQRLTPNSASLQVVVTTRPAAFTDVPRFPTTFRVLELVQLTPELISQYTDKWIRAKRLVVRDANDIRRVLKSRLEEPHLRELARNPMQLAILLSLIHTRGASLPDARTTLYDSYIELFFSREAEKTPIIRQHRDLLVDVHRYLAWLLHSQAELGEGSGRIGKARLVEVLKDYLAAEGRAPELIDDLFAGVIERVVALVSRVEGTYEFEVQPLREYFAARHLYETAPYSPAGAEQKGTLPDRFDAVARNFYWLNAARFYAGCFSKGELPALVDRLQALLEDSRYGTTAHPYVLAAMLLRDGVFTQNARSMRAAVDLVTTSLGVRHSLVGSSSSSRESSALALPVDAGRDVLVARCFSIMAGLPPLDYASEVCAVIRANLTDKERLPYWLAGSWDATEDDRTEWFRYGTYLGVLAHAEPEDLELRLEDRPLDPIRLSHLLKSGRSDLTEENEARLDVLVGQVLDNPAEYASRHRKFRTFTQLFATVVDSSLYRPVLLHDFGSNIQKAVGLVETALASSLRVHGETSEKMKRVLQTFVSQAAEDDQRWARSIEPWDAMVETLRGAWGDSWCAVRLALTASGIRARDEGYTDHADFLNPELSMSKRFRYARLRAGQASWWDRVLSEASQGQERQMALAVVFSWASPGTLAQIVGPLQGYVDDLSRNQLQKLLRAVRTTATSLSPSTTLSNIQKDLPGELSPRLALLIGTRMQPKRRHELHARFLSKYDGREVELLRARLAHEAPLLPDHPDRWGGFADLSAYFYRVGGSAIAPTASLGYQGRERATDEMPLDVAEKVTKEAALYPRDLVVLAEATCRSEVARSVVPLAEQAEQDKWFES